MSIVVTRHPGLLAVLKEKGIVTEEARVLSHVTAEEVRGQHVIGVLPLALAAEAETITEVSLNLPPELRGKELSEEQVRAFMTGINTYTVRRLAQ